MVCPVLAERWRVIRKKESKKNIFGGENKLLFPQKPFIVFQD